MTDCWAEKRDGALHPWGDDSWATFARLKSGVPIHVEIRQPRNAKHSALYWVLCHKIADAIGSTSENVSDVLKIGTGHCDIVRSKKHGELRLPRSISFARMDQAAFAEFFDRCVEVIQTEWGIARPDILSAVGDLLERPSSPAPTQQVA